MKQQIISEGTHFLSGVERVTVQTEWGDMANGLRFTIDGKSYECYEDKEDGYRSTGHILETDKQCKYNFPPQPVNIEWFDECDEYTSYKTWYLVMKDPSTDLVVLRVGTSDYNDYYPMAILDFTPENMKINL